MPQQGGGQDVDLSSQFRKKFKRLIILTWVGPPIVGFSFLLYIQMFNLEQMQGILMAPLENIFIVGSLVFAVWYFNHFIEPVAQLQSRQTEIITANAIKCMQRFPLHFWTIFLVYLLIAPSTVIVSAELYTDFVATANDWFRIHLVALIVSIIVGLPIFFRILDLFGRSLGDIAIEKPHVTIKAKVFMIGALTPLLIDTMLVQYFWTRTGFFTLETFVVWLALELLAIGGSLIFVHSISQSLRPLQSMNDLNISLKEQKTSDLKPYSTDELGVLATHYKNLIGHWQIQNEVLELNTRILRSTGSAASLSEIVNDVIRLCEEAIGDDMAFLILQSEKGDELVGVAQTDGPYSMDGYYRLSLDETSIAVWVYQHGEAVVLNDVSEDERVSSRMIEKFNVKSEMAVPLQVGDKTIGVLLTIRQQRKNNYTEYDLMLLEGMAREVAIAVQTYQLYQRRMAAELASQDNEELLHLLMSATEEGIYGIDTEGKCIFINPAGINMLGYDSDEELLGKNLHGIIHHTYPDGTEYPKEKCLIRNATQQGKSSHSDLEMHWRKDGTGFPSEYWSQPMYKEGKIIGTVVTFIDISERIKSLERIKYQSQVIEQVRDSIVATDLEGNITSWNKGAEKLFGYSEKEMLGKNINIVYPEEDRLELMALIDELKAKGTHETEVRMRRKDGNIFYANLSLSVLFDEYNKPAGMIGISTDITERKQTQDNLRRQAYHDRLTGLPNRWLLQDRIAQNIAVTVRDKKHGAVLFLDLDRFKVINDTLGHEYGDEVLLSVSNRLSDMVREGDTLARLGGDEFVMLLTNLHTLEEAGEIAQRLLFELKVPLHVRGREVHLGGSIGIAGYPEHGEDADTLLKHADFAMYRAKDKGGDIFQYYTADLHQEASARYQLENELRQAIENDEIEVHYQPQYDMKTNTVVGLEALCRWTSPRLGEVTPDNFIPVAEETGLIDRLGMRVIDIIMNHIFLWQQVGINIPRIAINLSAKQIYSDSCMDKIQYILRRNGLKQYSLEFEITENSLIDDPFSAEKNLKALKALGANIAIDDFGTGYSSLSYLQRYSVDVLKIDRSFIHDLVDNPDIQTIVETIVGMAQNLGLSVVAEGIENAEQAEFLIAHGCNIAQGFYYSKPLPAEECMRLLRAS